MFKKLLTTRSLCLSAIIAALYAALTLLLASISYGDLRCSEYGGGAGRREEGRGEVGGLGGG